MMKPPSSIILLIIVVGLGPTTGFLAGTPRSHNRAPRFLSADTQQGASAGRLFELCHLDETGRIVECEVLDEPELQKVLGEQRAFKFISNPSADAELLFGMPPKVTDHYSDEEEGDQDDAGVAGRWSEDSREVIFTVSDWKVCLHDDTCKVPDDVLLKVFGPDVKAKVMARAEVKARAMMDAQDGRTIGDQRFHLHFGAGRLGMGLVVPAISASGIPFAVVQRPKPRWQEVFRSGRGGKIDFKVDGLAVVRGVDVIDASGGQGVPEFMPPQALVFGSTAADLEGLLDRATSYSCSLGSAMEGVLLPLLKDRPQVEDPHARPLLFCCENDHAAVLKLKKKLEGRVRVVDCMVDKVCMGRTIKPDSVDIEAEPWRGSIVVLDPGLDERVPFAASVATLPRSEAEADYLSKRKFTLVNGMHTVVAFLTLINQYAGSDREYVLEKYTRMGRRDQRVIEAWRAARIGQLLEEFGAEQLMEWHGVSTREEVWDLLLNYSDEVLVDRFSKVDDLVSRVLGGGVANRWLTRLKPTEEWLSEKRTLAEARGRKYRVLGPQSATFQEERAAEEDDELRRFFAYAARHGPATSRRAAPRVLGEERARAAAAAVAAATTAAAAEAAAIAAGSAAEAPASAAGTSLPSGDEECDLTAEAPTGKCAEEQVAEALTSLLTSSRSFCKRELDKTHQALIKEQRKSGGKKFSPTAQKALQADLEKVKADLVEALQASQ